MAPQANASDSDDAGLEIRHRRPDGQTQTRPPLLLLHGLWHSAWSWENWLPFFAEQGFEVFAPSLPGYGASPGNPRRGRLASHLAIVRRLIAEIGAAPILIGHSYGGFLVQHLLAQRAFPGAVLVASAPHRYPQSALLRNVLRHPARITRSLLNRDLTSLADNLALVRELFFSPTTPAELVVAAAKRLDHAPIEAFIDMTFHPAPRPRGDTPVAVIAGGSDANFTVRLERRLARRLRADLIAIEGSGHDVPLDHRWHHTAQLTLTWIRGNAPPKGGEQSGASWLCRTRRQPNQILMRS